MKHLTPQQLVELGGTAHRNPGTLITVEAETLAELVRGYVGITTPGRHVCVLCGITELPTACPECEGEILTFTKPYPPGPSDES